VLADSASIPAIAVCVPAADRTEKVEKPDETVTVTVFIPRDAMLAWY